MYLISLGDPVYSPNSPYTGLLCVPAIEFGILRNPVTHIKMQSYFIESLPSTRYCSRSLGSSSEVKRQKSLPSWVQMYVYMSPGEMSEYGWVRGLASPLPQKATINLNKIDKSNHFSTLKRPEVYINLRGFSTWKTAELLRGAVVLCGVLALGCSDILPSQLGWWGDSFKARNAGRTISLSIVVEGGSLDLEQCAKPTFSSVGSGSGSLSGIEQGGPVALLAWGLGHSWVKHISGWDNMHVQGRVEGTQRIEKDTPGK